MLRKLVPAVLLCAFFLVSLPIAKADGMGGCGSGSGSTIDTTCSGSVTEASGQWSGAAQVSLTSPFTLSPDDPAFLVKELGSSDVNADQFSFSFNTASGTFSVDDITNNAYMLTGTVKGFIAGIDSITLSLLATQQTFYVAGSPCSITNDTGCVLTAPPLGTLVTSALTGEPLGTATIDYVGDPTVTSVTFDLPTSAPEPSSLLLLSIGLAGLGIVAFWRKRTADVVL